MQPKPDSSNFLLLSISFAKPIFVLPRSYGSPFTRGDGGSPPKESIRIIPLGGPGDVKALKTPIGGAARRIAESLQERRCTGHAKVGQQPAYREGSAPKSAAQVELVLAVIHAPRSHRFVHFERRNLAKDDIS